MKMRRGIVWSVAICVVVCGVLVLAAWEQPWGATVTKQIVTAARVNTIPAGVDDSAWAGAQAVEIPMDGKERFAGKKVTVSMKAVYSNDMVAMLFRWPDATHSVTKGAWQFDGQKWARLKGDEDRISLLFEITRIEQFATKGCAVACHIPAGMTAKEGKFGTRHEAEKGDLWHWKAARSAPYGHADDTWLAAATDKTGRKSDAGKGGDAANETQDKSRPMYMQDPAKKASAPGFLLKEEAVEITNHAPFKAGDVITYRMPVKPDGSRSDIKATSRYANGGWAVMLSRKLTTGNEDDVAFDPRREYSFAAAVFDDSGDEHSYDSEALTLRFGR